MLKPCIWSLCLFLVLSCTTDEDCQLNGDCVAGRCRCDDAWTGPTCSELHLLPVNPDRLGFYQSTTSSWGASVIPYDGKYYMYVSEMALNCGLKQWTTHSQIVLAVSDHVEGPYKHYSVLQEAEAHNPTVVRDTDGGLLLFHIGCRGKPLQPCPMNGSRTYVPCMMMNYIQSGQAVQVWPCQQPQKKKRHTQRAQAPL